MTVGARARRENYVLFSYNEEHVVVMAAEIHSIIDAPGKPGRKIIVGNPLSPDHAVYQEYVGKPTPASARVRNPINYFDSNVGGWPCGCGCGTEIFAGEFVAAMNRPPLHQRIAKIGTIPAAPDAAATLGLGRSPLGPTCRIPLTRHMRYNQRSEGPFPDAYGGGP